MTRIERQVLLKTAVLGVALTALVVAIDHAGGLIALERWLYDLRVKQCQLFTPPPTDRLMHLDIDDPTLEAVGRWPWDRSVVARMMDELARADARAVAFDVFFPEPQEARWVPRGEGFEVVNDDAELAASMKRYGHALVAVSFKPRENRSSIHTLAVKALRENLELTLPETAQRVAQLNGDASKPVKLDDNTYLAARRAAILERVDEFLRKHGEEYDLALRELLPHTSAAYTGSPLMRAMAEQWRRALSFVHLERFSRPIDPTLPPMLSVQGDAPPVPPLSAAAGQAGFVDFLPEGDGVVRSVPLWVEHRGRAFPQIGLALACMQMGVEPRDIRIEPQRVIVPRPGAAPLDIPVRTIDSRAIGGSVGYIMDVPWFGTKQWETMYDAPRHAAPAQHIPLSRVWSIVQARENLVRNNASADEAIKALLYVLDEAKLNAFKASPPAADDADARVPIIRRVLSDADAMGFEQAYAALPAAELSADESIVLHSIRALRTLERESPKLAKELADQRAALHAQLSGRSILIGRTASGMLDVVNTPLHAQAPGVITHGAVFNAILTGEVWRHAPRWVTNVVTAAVGVLATAGVLLFSPVAAFLFALLLALAYMALNGVLLFDYGNTIVGAAGPLTSVAVVWSAATLARFITERRERARITGRFRSYVDPALVSYVIEHPDQARLDGQVREMTVVFTDLAGFTTLSERLREKTVAILNEYMGLMVPVITRRGGFVNKFLGDGIMFFFGAPEPNTDHAADAILTALDMQRVLAGFNDELTRRELPTVTMRVGMNTGTMIVGDAGGAERSDYTVLGDAVNLAARLESANKAVGTRMMVTQRTVDLTGASRILFRPVGRLQVVGKSEGIMAYEPLCETVQADDRQRQLVEHSRAIVDRFLIGDFGVCLDHVAQYEATLGKDKFSALYRELCETYLATPPSDFSGAIVLTEK